MRIATAGRTASYEVAGTVSYGDVDSLGFGSIAAWDIESAQKVLQREGRFDSISIAAADGTSPAELVRAVQTFVLQVLEHQQGRCIEGLTDASVTGDQKPSQCGNGQVGCRPQR